MRQIKVNYNQVMAVLESHLESLRLISPEESLELPTLKDDKGMVTLFVERISGDKR